MADAVARGGIGSPTSPARGQVCQKGITLIVRGPARNARWYVLGGDSLRGRAGKGWAVVTWLFY
eukprot:6765386-Prymnesium_polylepis.1